MRNYFNIRTIFVTLSVALSACSTEIKVPKAPTVTMPEIKFPKFDIPEFPKPTGPKCIKNETDQNFTDEAKQNVFTAEVTVQTEYKEFVGCDGKITGASGAANFFKENVDVPAPATLAGKIVKYIEVENPRTCTQLKVEAQDKPNAGLFAVASKDGALNLPISKETLILGQLVSVDGLNVVTLSYYGDNGDKIAAREIIIDFKINYVAVPANDRRVINICDKK